MLSPHSLSLLFWGTIKLEWKKGHLVANNTASLCILGSSKQSASSVLKRPISKTVLKMAMIFYQRPVWKVRWIVKDYLCVLTLIHNHLLNKADWTSHQSYPTLIMRGKAAMWWWYWEAQGQGKGSWKAGGGQRGPGGERKKWALSLQGVTVRGLGNLLAAVITTIHKPKTLTHKLRDSTCFQNLIF